MHTIDQPMGKPRMPTLGHNKKMPVEDESSSVEHKKEEDKTDSSTTTFFLPIFISLLLFRTSWYNTPSLLRVVLPFG